MININKKLFFQIWKNNGDIYDYFTVAKKICPQLNFISWDKQWQNHSINHENQKEALKQFQSAVFLAGGDWNKVFEQ